MRLDRGDHIAHATHNFLEIDTARGVDNPVISGAANIGHNPSAADDRLARHAACVQTVATHFFLLDQHDTGLRARHDKRGHQPCRTATDHHNIGIEAGRLLVSTEPLASLQLTS